jgi:hypothetical protein
MRNHSVVKCAAVAVTGVLALLGFVGPASASDTTVDGAVSVQGTCDDSFHPSISGGEAAWNLVCASGGITIGGWVKDTAADGKCAYIKAFAGNGDSRVPLAKACPKGTVTQFSWRVNNTSEIRAYLFVA